MNYGQLKQELVNLGFADSSELEEFGTIVTDAINRAITEINLTVAPIIGKCEITQEGDDDDILYYDIPSLAADNEDIFLEFADNPVMIGENVYKRFNNFEIEDGTILVIDGNIEGTFRVFYKKAHTPITLETADEEEMELPTKTHILLPLLSAYYIWLEDEKAKAVDYYNQYEKLSQIILANSMKPRMTILSGGI